MLENSSLFSHFSAGSDIQTDFFNFLNLGKSRFPKNMFITSTTQDNLVRTFPSEVIVSSILSRDLQSKFRLQLWIFNLWMIPVRGPNLDNFLGSGCGSAGRAVASCDRGLWF